VHFLSIKIIVDSISLLSPLTGIGKYTNEISKYLEKDDDLDISYFYGYYSKKCTEPNQGSKVKSIKALILSRPLLKKIARKALMFTSKLFAPKFDLYWQPNFIPLDDIKASKIVTTVHDFSFYLHPEWHPKERLNYFNTYFFQNAKRSDWIITCSEFTKNEIVKYLQFEKEKITVIHNGIDQNVYKTYDSLVLNTSKKKYELQDNFLLFVGSIEPRKNLLNLIKAYTLLSSDTKEHYPLILVGFKGWKNREIMQEIEKEKKHIRYLGYLCDEELAHIYNLATLFIFPSFYEGFGIPPLEAMACATAVISSNTSSLPEACGDAAEYIEPNNYEQIAEKINLLLIDTIKRKQLIEKGLERVKYFTWEQSAKGHREVFNKVLSV
jgi:glycosyltransferase involved in cell wall biosynthesis